VNGLAKILFPIDFSQRSAGAARYAQLLAGHFQAELILLHVIPLAQYQYAVAEGGGIVPVEIYQSRNELVAKDLKAFAAKELAGAHPRLVVMEGDPAQRIVEFAHQEQAGLILMPTHGYGPFRRFILGSNTAKVLHDADCPVWTGVHIEHAPAPISLPLRSILCAVDLGPQSERTLAWAAHMQRELGGRLTLMHAAGAAPEPAEAAGAAWRLRVRAAVEEELQRLLRTSGGQADLLVESGDPAHAICKAAAQLQSDVLVIGRGSAAGVFGRLRTNAYAIIRESPCPVVSV
jgi:nucleotide-binding universal stress UspA family protein